MPSLPASGEVLTPKVMRSTGSSTVEAGQRLGVGRVGEGVADLDLGEPGDHEQVAGRALVDLDAADALEAHEAGELALQRLLALADLLVEQGDLLALAQRAPHDPADGQAAEVVGGVEVGDDGLQRRVGVAGGGGTVADDGVEQGGEVVVGAGHADARHGLGRRGRRPR